MKRFGCFPADKREGICPVTVQPGGNSTPLVKHDTHKHTHTIRQTGRAALKGPVTFQSCPVLLNLNMQAPPLNSDVSFELHYDGDETG